MAAKVIIPIIIHFFLLKPSVVSSNSLYSDNLEFLFIEGSESVFKFFYFYSIIPSV